MAVIGNWTQMTYSSGGAGALTLAKTTNYPSFNETLVGMGFCAATNSDVSLEVHYDLVDATVGSYESGIGTFNPSTNVLTRTRIIKSVTTSGGVSTVVTNAATAITASATTSVFLGSTVEAATSLGVQGTGYIGTALSATNYGYYPLNYFNGGAQIAAATNWEMWLPMLWDGTSAIDAVSIMNGTGTAGNVQIGIYECKQDGTIGKLLWDSGSFLTVASTANLRLVSAGTPAALTLHPGWYWYVVNSSNSTQTFMRADNTQSRGIMGLNASMVQRTAFTKNVTFGTLADPGPALSTSGNITAYLAASTGIPALSFRMAV